MRKTIHFLAFSFFIFLTSHILCAQDTLYYDKENNKTTDIELAKYYVIAKENVFRYYNMNETLYQEEFYTYQPNEFKIDTLKLVKYWDTEDKLYWEESLKNGELHGDFIVYWDNGIVKRKEKYLDGKFIEGNCFNKKGKKIRYFEFEKMPEYRGGMSKLYTYLTSKLKYPEDARQLFIQGIVLVEFVIEKDGRVSNVQVKKTVFDSLDEEAVRVVSNMPKWKPGMSDNKPVRCYFHIPIQFSLY